MSFPANSNSACLSSAQQPNQNLVDEGQEAYTNNLASWPPGNVVNKATVDHQHQEQQHNITSQRIPTFAAMQAGAMEEICSARDRLRPVGMGVPKQHAGNDSQPSVFEGTGVALEKKSSQEHIDARRARLASGEDKGEEVVVGTSVESSEFQSMHQKLRSTNLH